MIKIKEMTYKIVKLFLTFLMFLFIGFGVDAQVIEEEEEEMPVFEDHEIEDDKPIVETWPRSADTVRFKRGYVYGFVCNKKEILIPFEYSELPRKFAKVMVAKKQGMMGVINNKNEIIVPFEYKRITHYRDCFSVFKGTNKAGKWGILDFEGNVILPVEYAGAGPYTGKLKIDGKHPAYYAGKDNGNVKLFLDEAGKLIKEVPYRRYHYLSDQYNRVINDKYKHGIVNNNDEIILECKYGHVFWAKGDIGCVTEDRKMFLINLKDKTVHHDAFKYYNEVDMHNNIIVYNSEGKVKHHALMNVNGETLVAPADQMILFVDGTNMYAISKGGKIVDLLDVKGKSIPGIEKYPIQINGLRDGFYTARYEDDNNMRRIFKSDRTEFTSDLYSTVYAYDPLHKYPANIDVTRLIAEVHLDRKAYYLFMDGTKVEKK